MTYENYRILRSFIGTATAIHLHTAYGCFHATISELSSGERDSWLQNQKRVRSGPLQKMIADPYCNPLRESQRLQIVIQI